MLFQEAKLRDFESLVQRYLVDTLGIRAALRPWKAAETLPFFLQEAFTVRQLALDGHDLLIAIDKGPEVHSPAKLRVQIERLRTLVELPVIYATETLASYERRRLIEYRIPFLVPGNQLYLPDLGIDLREYFRTRSRADGTPVSPATQAVLVAMLLSEPWKNEWVVSEIVARLGYTAMTLTRVLRELSTEGIANVHRHGRERRLHVDGAPQEVWDRARKSLSSPVKRSIWVPTVPGAEPAPRLAGLSALAHLTHLADPPSPVFAIGPNDWRRVKQAKRQLSMQPIDGFTEWQLWSYSPAIQPKGLTVDPLSLMLSLESIADERIQMALDELREHLPW